MSASPYLGGGSPTMHQHGGGHSSSKKGPSGGVATASPTTTTMPTRNDGGNTHPSSSKSVSSLPQKFIHESPKQYQSVHQQHREVIELTDSDNDNNSPATTLKSHNSPNASRSAAHLQPPFEPFPRAPNGSSTKSGHRASASPSIASLINPDNQQPKQSNPSPTSAHPAEAYIKTEQKAEKSAAKKKDNSENLNRSPKSKAGTAASSTAASPKPSRPAVPTGNGLLAGVLPNTGGNDEPEPQVPNIYLHVPLNGENNKYVNFAKLAEERYGWAALNPKLAKARQMMDSGDEMLLDGSESESNVEMGGVTGDSTAVAPKKRAKRKNHDIYDKNDPFIDDSEMLWEEQAAASKDGFFVYSGPLVPEGEKPQIERADGTVKRGRGRGRGSAPRGTASTRGATVRKPRLTKKEKEKMEKEKEERERFSTLQMTTQPLNFS